MMERIDQKVVGTSLRKGCALAEPVGCAPPISDQIHAHHNHQEQASHKADDILYLWTKILKKLLQLRNQDLRRILHCPL
jgi:hypothetical protein